MQYLLIRHRSESAGCGFEVQRVEGGRSKSASVVELTDPLRLQLGGSDLDLGHELAWYLESYLDLPIGPNVQRAERVQTALRDWGRQSFELLLGQGQARDFYRDATRNGHTQLHLVVASDDPRVLSWPWEALSDPQVGDLAHLCRIERQLDTAPDTLELPAGLPDDRVHILLVTARPYDNDVAYRSITRPLVELIQQEQLPAQVKLLRPPTFEQLRRELQEHPGQYHIVHFDGHGSFGQVTDGRSDRFKGPQGRLVFENANSGEDAITGAQLSQLLREHRIPIAVLNACQSAMLNEQADDAFASVATALLRAGVRSVVAMGYSLYVSGARQFLPAFYRQLFTTGNVAEATRSGRQAMLAKPQRNGKLELQDWLVPVLYQQNPLTLTFAAQAQGPKQLSLEQIPQEARVEASHAPHGVIGRDSAVLALERASRRLPPALLVHGLGGVGKTTLARGYIEWLAQTQGLPDKVIWQSLADVRSFDYLRNRLVEELFGTDAMALQDDKKWPELTQVLRQQAVLIVWDNFESASGTADAGGAELEAMPAEDRQQLKQWLEQLRGGASRVLITSRSDEQWLGTTACFRAPLGGMQGEERQELARAILADQGMRLDPRDADTAELINSLQGHPLMMRAILPKLKTVNARQLRQDFEQYVPQADSTDPVEQRLYATLRYVEEGLPESLRPLLHPIGLHEGFVVADFLAGIAKEAEQPFELAQVCQALELLEAAGLVRGVGNNVYELHPALERHARVRSAQQRGDAEARMAWDRGFCASMAVLADQCTPMELHKQRHLFLLFGGSLGRALILARSMGLLVICGALLQFQATYALNRHNLPLAQNRLEVFAELCEQIGRDDWMCAAYHHLGRVAQQRHDLDAAEVWHRKSLAIAERLGNANRVAPGYYHLGMVAWERLDLDSAEAWWQRALEIYELPGDSREMAATYLRLGAVAAERQDLEAAESWYGMSLGLAERLGDEQLAAFAYHQLGELAHERRDFDAAEAWHRKTLEIKEREGNEHGAASSYLMLGNVAQERREFELAEAGYRKASSILDRLGDQRLADFAREQLFTLANRSGDAEVNSTVSQPLDQAQSHQSRKAFNASPNLTELTANAPPSQLSQSTDAPMDSPPMQKFFRRDSEQDEATFSIPLLAALGQVCDLYGKGPELDAAMAVLKVYTQPRFSSHAAPVSISALAAALPSTKRGPPPDIADLLRVLECLSAGPSRLFDMVVCAPDERGAIERLPLEDLATVWSSTGSARASESGVELHFLPRQDIQ